MRIYQKGLIMIAVPLMAGLFFNGILLGFLYQAESEIDEQMRIERTKTTIREMDYKGRELGMLVAQYSVNEDEQYLKKMENCKNSIKALAARLRKVFLGDRVMQAKLSTYDKKFQEYVDVLEQARMLVDKPGHASDFEKLTLFADIKEKSRDLLGILEDSMSSQKAFDLDQATRTASTRLHLRILLGMGVLANIVIAAFLAQWFSKQFIIKIDHLKENSLRLARGQELTANLEGEDELAQLDNTFHKVANILNDAFDRETAVFHNATDVICSLDGGGRITRLNRAFRDTLGYNEEEALQVHLVQYVADSHKQSVHEFLQFVKSDSRSIHKIEAVMRSQGEGQRMLLWSVKWEPSRDSYYCVAHDVTEQKQLEQAKQDFVAMLSHDLRSPLTSIGLTFELLLAGAFGTQSDRCVARLNQAHKSVGWLISLINELLDLEKLEAGEMEIVTAWVSAEAMIERAIEAVRAVAENNQIKLTTEPTDLMVLVDEDRLLRVLINFLSNAIKFSPPDGEVSLELTAGKDFVEFRVSDQGPGIAPENQEQVFERYKQVDPSEPTTKKGTGLGLAICKAVVTAHGGAIGVDSELGKGSSFWFVIPHDWSAAPTTRQSQ